MGAIIKFLVMCLGVMSFSVIVALSIIIIGTAIQTVKANDKERNNEN